MVFVSCIQWKVTLVSTTVHSASWSLQKKNIVQSAKHLTLWFSTFQKPIKYKVIPPWSFHWSKHPWFSYYQRKKRERNKTKKFRQRSLSPTKTLQGWSKRIKTLFLYTNQNIPAFWAIVSLKGPLTGRVKRNLLHQIFFHTGSI